MNFLSKSTNVGKTHEKHEKPQRKIEYKREGERITCCLLHVFSAILNQRKNILNNNVNLNIPIY